MSRRIIALVLCVFMVLGALSGCKRSDKSKPAVAEKVPNSFKADFIPLPENYEPNYNGTFIAGDRIYMMCYVRVSESPYHVKYVLYSIDMNGENPDEEFLYEYKEGLETNTYINYVKISDAGEKYYVGSSYDMETYVSTYYLLKKAADGTEVFNVDPQSFFPVQETNSDGYYRSFYPQSLEIDDDGNIYIAGGNGEIAVVSPDGKKLFDLTTAGDGGYGYVESMTKINGKVVVAYYDYSGNGGYVRKYIDVESKKFGENIEFPDIIGQNNYNYTLYMGPGYDMYFKSTTGLFGYNEGNTELVELLNWINSDINPNDVNSLSVLSPEKIIYSGYNQVLGKYEVAFLNRIPDEDVIPKYLIRLVSADGNTYDLINQIINYNRSNEEYRIILDDYSRYRTDEDWQYGVTVLNNEIAAGKIPDIVVSSGYSSLPVDSYEKMGMFVNLYDFFEKDEDISADEILKCIRTPYEKNGKLYRLIDGFYIQTFAAKKEYVGDKTSWSISDMINLAKNLNEGTYLFDYMTKEYMLQSVCYMGIAEFINYTTGQCTFDSQAFIDLLKYIDTLPSQEDYNSGAIISPREAIAYAYDSIGSGKIIGGDVDADGDGVVDADPGNEDTEAQDTETEDTDTGESKDAPAPAVSSSVSESVWSGGYNNDYNAPYKTGQIILYSEYLSSIDSYIRTVNTVFGTKEVTYIGYPGVEGNGSAISSNTAYSISSKSNPTIQEGAWQYLKYILSDEMQNRQYRYNFPSTYSALDKLIEKEKKTYRFYYDNGGGWSSQEEPFTDEQIAQMESWGQTGKVIEFTEEYETFLRQFLDSVRYKGNDDNKILEIINEECELFFAGTKTAEETAKVIQSKVSIYVSESN